MSYGIFNHLRHGGTSRCTILIVSSDEVCAEKLMVAVLKENTESHDNKFQINGCMSVLEAINSTRTGNSDYIVMVINPCRFNWDTEVEENIGLLDKAYLCSRICLVVDTTSIAENRSDTLYRIGVLREKFKSSVMYGEFNRTDIVLDLSQGLLRLVDNVCCNRSGLPFPTEFPEF